MPVQVRDGIARTPDGAIAGSTLRMRRPPEGALGLTDVGEIRGGARADLAVLDEDLEVTRVIRAGARLRG